MRTWLPTSCPSGAKMPLASKLLCGKTEAPNSILQCVPFCLYGDGAEVFSTNNLELFTMITCASSRSSTLDTRFLRPVCSQDSMSRINRIP